MTGKRELTATHIGYMTHDPLTVRCKGCTLTFGSWQAFGEHLDGLLEQSPHSKEEAIRNVLADHLGDPDEHSGWDWCLDVILNDHGRIVCGCGWESDNPDDIDEWRNHMADAILKEIGRIRQ